MSRAEHAYKLDDLLVHLIVPDGVIAPRWVEVMQGDAVVRLRHAGVRNLRAAVKRKPRQVKPLTPMSEDWEPPAEVVAALRAECPSVPVETQAKLMRDWAISRGEARADWVASLRKWVRSSHAENVAKGWKPTRGAVPVGESEMQKWLREHGVTEAEYLRRKDESGWLEMIKRRGRVA